MRSSRNDRREAPAERRRTLHRRLLAAACAALVAGTSSGCATTDRAPRFADEDYPGVLRAPEALGADVLWRQHITAVWGADEESRGFDGAVQKAGSTLTVLGLSPTGSVGFAIVLREGQVELTERMPEGLPFPPRYVVLDVQRAFYPWLPAQEPTADGLREGAVDGEHVAELWRAGRLRERRFTRLDGVPSGAVTVRYVWDRPDWSAPTRAVLENGWFGYRLEIETHAETLLDPSGGAS